MLIGGLQRTSLIDFPGRMCAIIFTVGCNLRCSFCYNPELVLSEAQYKEKQRELIAEDDVLELLQLRRHVVDAVCITGGEPTLQKDLVSFIRKLKAQGFAVKLDTNGTNPDVLKVLLDEALLDYVAMDVKVSLETYDEVARVSVPKDGLKKSIELLKAAAIPYEFRTTCLPGITDEAEIQNISMLIKGAKKYYVQQFFPFTTLDVSWTQKQPFAKADLERFREIASMQVQDAQIRGV